MHGSTITYVTRKLLRGADVIIDSAGSHRL
jgi:hypothetical protein